MRRNRFSSGVRGQYHPKSSISTPQRAAGRWNHGARGNRSASTPPKRTKITKRRWRNAVRLARTPYVMSYPGLFPEPPELRGAVAEVLLVRGKNLQGDRAVI